MASALGLWPIFQWAEKLLQLQGALGMYAWHRIEAHGYIAMFLLLVASGMGLPLPEDIPLIAAGVSVARGSMTWPLAASAAWLGMMVGDSILYILGYALGWRVVHLPLIGRHLKPTRLRQCELWFERWGVWAVGIGRMFAGIRTAMVVAAGTLHYTYLKMIAADAVAATISGGAFMILGYWAGKHARKVYRHVFTLIALGAALALILVLWWKSKRGPAASTAKALEEVAHPVEPM
jgi:membrane-associated protein